VRVAFVGLREIEEGRGARSHVVLETEPEEKRIGGFSSDEA
jgi:hypothetical protein